MTLPTDPETLAMVRRVVTHPQSHLDHPQIFTTCWEILKLAQGYPMRMCQQRRIAFAGSELPQILANRQRRSAP